MSDTPSDALRLPSIDGLLAFEAAARLGSLERAAEALHVSASAVGKRIATLEERLGQPLLTRHPLRLTAAGKEYLGQVQTALSLLAAVPLHRRDHQRVTRLGISSPPTFARQVLVPALPGFQAAHPDIELELLLSTPYLDQPAPPADVEIFAGAMPAGGEVLLDDVVTPMAAPALLARLPAIHAPADLASAPLLRTPLQPWTPWLRAAGLDWAEPAQGTRFIDLGLTLEAAACGQGVVLGRPSLAATWLRGGTLKRLFDLAVPAALPYGLVRHHDGDAARAFSRWLVRHCETLSADAGHA
ncbi:LysR family transcriptional regulator [Mitsuaria sp. GD03876]|uniref:LysR family transcriptional regulator n=1 Tax=Mitsuaria sp. GD03876 TaxID=2975399 RepID=UPI00244D1738|nr:LysR family transcriptional regulator [Mitsuaria sp. GD03876]MDH0867956.1 LysR family transcriptional regulator [Mitsuaria sp. GD03876]